jgi:glutathione S-transferase
MPKPDYTPLTGGYRRTPALQIGADVYCDTQVILAEIERRRPTPSLWPDGGEGLVWAFNWWADRLFFQTTVPIIFGALGDQVPEAFIKDREALSGRPFDLTAMAAAATPLKGQWRAQAAWLETRLAASPSGWLNGDAPSIADAAAYMNVWFMGRNLMPVLEALTQDFERFAAWRERIRRLGHGRRQDLGGAEALNLAKAHSPAPAPDHDPHDPLGLSPGDPVVVMADDYGRDPIVGDLVAATPERVVIARTHDRTGLVHVHFPRAGYLVVRA